MLTGSQSKNLAMLWFQPCILPAHLSIVFLIVDWKYLGGFLFCEPGISLPLWESICGNRVIEFKVKVTQDSLKGGECGSAIRRCCVTAREMSC